MDSALIVCGDDSRGAVTAVRSLHRAGWQVGVATPSRRSLAGASRSVTDRHVVPRARVDRGGFLRAVTRAVDERGYDVVLAGGDDELVALSTDDGRLGSAVPSSDVVNRALDKLALSEAVAGTGLSSPATWARWEDVVGPGPFIVKPRFAYLVEEGPAGGSRLPAVLCPDAASAQRAGDDLWARSVAPLFQRVVQGALVAYSAVVDEHGTHHCRVLQRSDRLWPTPAGISARARTIGIDDAVANGCAALLARLGWRGLVQLQLLETAQGERFVMDLNGRLYGSIRLAVAAGADLPLAWARLLRGEQPGGQDARAGVTYEWLYGDVRRALVERRGGVLRDLAGCAATAVRAAHSVLDLRDPGPARLHLVQLVASARRQRT